MTACWLGALLLLQNPTGGVPKPSELISRAMAKYAAAQTIVGTIRLTQAAAGQSGTIETTLQIQRPDRLFLRQVQNKTPAKVWLVTCDGRGFTYDAPVEAEGQKPLRLYESLNKETGRMTVQDVYRATVASIGDRSAPLDIAIGHKEDLRFVAGQWATLQLAGQTEVRGALCHKIRGLWREFPGGPAVGRFELYIDEQNLIRRYAIEQTIRLQPNQPPLQVVSVWDVDLRLDAAVDPALFRLVR
ncbi:MAG: hypothetical protein N2109_10480 [Fimbriimonadales bacterium]|nr:hypothetical protein [Fimbriimonadales bacterium]